MTLDTRLTGLELTIDQLMRASGPDDIRNVHNRKLIHQLLQTLTIKNLLNSVRFADEKDTHKTNV